MMFTKNVLRSRLMDKFNNLAFKSIVTETFIGALPLSDLDKRDKAKLTDYSFSILESLGGYNLLLDAMKNSTNEYNKAFLNEINDICNSVATEASDRIIKNAIDGDEDDPDTVDKAKLSKDEKMSFFNKVKSSDITGVSEEIKQKVIDVISDEKLAYQTEKAIKDDINNELHKDMNGTDNLTDDDDDYSEDDDSDFDDNGNTDNLTDDNSDGDVSNLTGESFLTFESLLDIIGGKNSVRNHKSVFSTLQSACVESLIHLKNNYEPLNGTLMKDMTYNFYKVNPVIKTKSDMISAFESINNYTKEPQLSVITPKDVVLENSLTNTIGIYTMIETLNSLNLAVPDVHVAKDFVESNTAYESINTIKAGLLDASIKETASKFETEAIKSNNIATLNRCKNALENLISLVEKGNGSTQFITALTNAMESVDTKISSVISKNRVGEIIMESREAKNDVANMNYIYSLIGKNPNVSKINFVPTTESMVDVIAYDNASNEIRHTSLDLEYDFGSLNRTMESYLKNVVQESKFAGSKVGTFLKKDWKTFVNLK